MFHVDWRISRWYATWRSVVVVEALLQFWLIRQEFGEVSRVRIWMQEFFFFKESLLPTYILTKTTQYMSNILFFLTDTPRPTNDESESIYSQIVITFQTKLIKKNSFLSIQPFKNCNSEKLFFIWRLYDKEKCYKKLLSFLYNGCIIMFFPYVQIMLMDWAKEYFVILSMNRDRSFI